MLSIVIVLDPPPGNSNAIPKLNLQRSSLPNYEYTSEQGERDIRKDCDERFSELRISQFNSKLLSIITLFVSRLPQPETIVTKDVLKDLEELTYLTVSS